MIRPNRCERREKRTSAEVVVMLSGQNGAPVREWASTENSRARGARILTTHRWRPNDTLLLRCVDGNLQARGRVIYCQRLRDSLSVIGVKLLVPWGSWSASSDVQPCKAFSVAISRW